MPSARPSNTKVCRRPRRSWPKSKTARSISWPFLEAHDPRVIVYDLPRPFERHWNFLRLLRQADALRKRTWAVVGARSWTRSTMLARMDGPRPERGRA
jgi:hypothetical protein